MIEIFGSDYFAKKSLEETFKMLIGASGHKPFECVGTINESKLAMALSKKSKVSENAQKLFKDFDRNHFLPLRFEEILKLMVSDSVLILGYGREGKSVHRFLLDRFPFIKIAIADREKDGKDYLSRVKEFSTIIRSPGVPPSNKIMTSSTNIFFSVAPGRIIGVTGTKGKSTTSSLITKILQSTYQDVRLIGNIGAPSLDSLKNSNSKTIFVFELSSHQLVDCKFSPNVAVVLDVVPEHLDYYKDFSSYIKAKESIVRYQKTSDFVVFNPEHKISTKIAQKSQGAKITFSQADIYKFMDVAKIPLLGKGNLENIMAAAAVGRLFDVPLEKIKKAVHNFVPLEHRLEYVGEFGKIRFYNDSLATVPQATIHALEALGDDVETLIAGGFDRGIDFSGLNKYLETSSVKNLILFPTTGKNILKNKANRFNVSTMEEA
ncbi:MAG: UDP-N-acetylmuramoyl-L-alanine--D-glutamate ligase, partial [bacterium]|nr:UDP-N-acetylmuramoyl-L-alanine--D-glutamate ligase [bacterium]